ncbi:MAG: lipoate protein ligase C-terminal domain-containing protein [Anaerolineales bacterium]
MDVYDLGTVPWRLSQTYYHALAYLRRPGLILLQPGSPYVCLGYHQDARVELDLDYVNQQAIPLFRREVGGGAVYLDRGQLFYQFVFDKEDPRLPASKDAFYRKFLEPVVATFRDFGLPAEFKPVNDILVGGRKISGNGAAEIGESVVLVGNFMLDFNYDQMARVLRVPDEKFRDKVHKSLAENLTTMKRELREPPTLQELSKRLLENSAPLVGGWTPAEIDSEIKQKAEEIWESHSQPQWTFFNDARRRDGREIKIAEGVSIVQKVVKLPGGLVRVTATNKSGSLYDIHLSGDFFIYPQEAVVELEHTLEGTEYRADRLTAVIEDFFERRQVEAPGLAPNELAEAFLP